MKKGTGQREVRPVWNNAIRTNHQNFSNSRSNFAPTAVLTKSGLVPISTARQSSSREAAPVSTARPIKTAAPKPFMNVVKSRPNAFQKSHSPYRRSFYQHTSLKNRNLNNRVNTVKVESSLEFKVLVVYHTTNGHQFTMSNRQERIGYSRANDNWISKIDCLLSSEVLFEGRLMMSIMHSSMIGNICNIRQKVSNIGKSKEVETLSATPEVSTAAEGLVYKRRSAKKKKDKGKAIIIEDESVQKMSKKQMQEERLGHEESIRL
ncbi:hypothetical protein Tco_0186121 [Tanacetum coccineum]